MKKVFTLLFLVSTSLQANWFDSLDFRSQRIVTAVVGVADAATKHDRSTSGHVGASDESQCLELFNKAADKWNGKSLYPIYLQGQISSWTISDDPKDMNFHQKNPEILGLSENVFIRANSWSPALAPHMESACKQFYRVSDSFINKQGNCRVTSIEFMNHSEKSYQMKFCKGEHQVELDSMSKEMNPKGDEVNCEE